MAFNTIIYNNIIIIESDASISAIAFANFTSYTEELFDDKNQLELARFVQELDNKGAKIVVSNSDPKNTNKDDDFFDKAYSKQNIKRVSATRMINRNSDARGKISELLISNFNN